MSEVPLYWQGTASERPSFQASAFYKRSSSASVWLPDRLDIDGFVPQNREINFWSLHFEESRLNQAELGGTNGRRATTSQKCAAVPRRARI